MCEMRMKMVKRVLTTILCVLVIFYAIPIPNYVAQAARGTHTGVTITVQDIEGNPISGATVNITISSTATGESSLSLVTGTDGVVEALPASEFVADEQSLSATAVCQGYAVVSDISDSQILTDDQDMIITMRSSVIQGVTISAGASLVYNGQPLDLIEITGINELTDTVTYEYNGNSYMTIPQETLPGTYSVTVTVKRVDSGFHYDDLVQTIDAEIINKTIDDTELSISANTINYTGTDQELVSLTGTDTILESDSVTWSVNGVQTGSRDIPTGIDVGDYEVQLILDRQYHNQVIRTVSVTIGEGTIELGSLSVEEKSDLEYDGNEKELLTVSDVGDYTLEYKVTDSSDQLVSDWSTNFPVATNIGDYKVYVRASKTYYTTLDVPGSPFEVSIAPGSIQLGTLVVSGVPNLIYSGNGLALVEVENQGDYDLMFKCTTYEDTLISDWTQQIPEAVNAGKYKIYVKAVKSGYSDKPISNDPIVVEIAKCPVQLSFTNYSGSSDDVTLTGAVPYVGVAYDFSASANTQETGDITYRVETLDSGIATIDSQGCLQVSRPGTITVFAEFSNNDNYGGEISYVMYVSGNVNTNGDFISFATPTVSYTLGENNGVASNKTASLAQAYIDGDIVYSVDTTHGLAIDADTGCVSVSDYAAVVSAIDANNGSYEVNVTATKQSFVDSNGKLVYGEDHASYTLQISYGSFSNVGFTYSGTELDVDGELWYISAVEVSADSSNYTITDNITNGFSEHILISDQGTDTRYVFIQDTTSGAISEKIALDDLRIDTMAPVLGNISYSSCSYDTGTTKYYGGNNGTVQFGFSITEANFIESDVSVTVIKSGNSISVSPYWTNEGNQHNASINISGDGNYRISVNYTDKTGHAMTGYLSDELIIDTGSPIITVEYQNKDVVNTREQSGVLRRYYNAVQTAIVTIVDANFDSEAVSIDIAATDVSGASMSTSNLVSMSEWGKQGDANTMSISFSGDANYSLSINCIDIAQNTAANTFIDNFTVDTKVPTIKSVTYSPSYQDSVIGNTEFSFYNSKVTVTVVLEDVISGVRELKYSYQNANGVSSVNSQLLDQVVNEGNISYTDGGRSATVVFDLPAGTLTDKNQFNGYLNFEVYDRATNHANYEGNKRIVIDNISPVLAIDMNAPVNIDGDVSYFDEDVVVSVTITEANVDLSEVQIKIYKDETLSLVPIEWSDINADIHRGVFKLTDEGNYTFSVSYTDRSGNEMEGYSSKQIVVDKHLDIPTVLINGEEGNLKAFSGVIIPEISFQDTNFDRYELSLTRTRLNEKNADVTDLFIGDNFVVDEKGGTGIFDTFELTTENDGIYTLYLKVWDKAGHEQEVQTVFSANRYGSVYEYSDYLNEIIKDGGQFIKADDEGVILKEDLVITEYNADRLLTDSLSIVITRDGEIINASYATTPKRIDSDVTIGESGWYQYTYVIDKDNFVEDGIYKISLSSKYKTDDSPENQSFSMPENSFSNQGERVVDTIGFVVDTTAPEIRNIVNLEKSIVDTDKIVDGKLTVKYSVIDVGGLKTVEIYVNGDVVDKVTDFGDSINNYSGEFSILESNSKQSVRLVVMDMAGNVTDTESEEFDPGSRYVFSNHIMVSTNFFVRMYTNKPLFFGSIGGIVVAAGGAGMFIRTSRRRKKMK